MNKFLTAAIIFFTTILAKAGDACGIDSSEPCSQNACCGKGINSEDFAKSVCSDESKGNPDSVAYVSFSCNKDEVVAGLGSLYLTLIIVVSILILLAICRCMAIGKSNKHYPDLTDKIIIITGANTGIGFTTAQQLAKLNPKTIVFACRDQSRALNAMEKIKIE